MTLVRVKVVAAKAARLVELEERKAARRALCLRRVDDMV